MDLGNASRQGGEWKGRKGKGNEERRWKGGDGRGVEGPLRPRIPGSLFTLSPPLAASSGNSLLMPHFLVIVLLSLVLTAAVAARPIKSSPCSNETVTLGYYEHRTLSLSFPKGGSRTPIKCPKYEQ